MENNDIYGVSCAVYRRTFVEKLGDDNTMPSIKTPIWVYLGRHEQECTYTLLSKYHMDKLDNRTYRKSR